LLQEAPRFGQVTGSELQIGLVDQDAVDLKRDVHFPSLYAKSAEDDDRVRPNDEV
jgi:hypothetical protein